MHLLYTCSCNCCPDWRHPLRVAVHDGHRGWVPQKMKIEFQQTSKQPQGILLLYSPVKATFSSTSRCFLSSPLGLKRRRNTSQQTCVHRQLQQLICIASDKVFEVQLGIPSQIRMSLYWSWTHTQYTSLTFSFTLHTLGMNHSLPP